MFKSIDNKGNPLPWMNYSMIDFLNERLNKSITIFEYGSGYSTMFFSKMVKKITSVEHDTEWFKKIESEFKMISNVDLRFKPLDNSYFKAISKFTPKNNKYHLIIIDSRQRVECAELAINYLTPEGIILLDDSGRKRYSEIFNILRNKGFRELTISGLKPTGLSLHKSTLFYKSNNIFNI